jgi:hypothetical protein
MNRAWIRAVVTSAFVTWTAVLPSSGVAQEIDRAADRGPGVPSSMFGTYIQQGELVLYPFFEYYRDGNAEYAPNEFGYGLDEDFRGEYEGREWLLFLGYGLGEDVLVELEAAHISATLERSPEDPTGFPAEISESGIGDVEAQIRWRWADETATRPEFFSFFETVFPLQKDKLLIGTQDWEFKLGAGLVRGFGWGTLAFRLAAEYDGEEDQVGPGEYALEYLNRLSPSLRLYAGIEGSEDEVELIPEVQWFLRENLVMKLNSAVGITSKAADWAPEVGLMFFFR